MLQFIYTTTKQIVEENNEDSFPFANHVNYGYKKKEYVIDGGKLIGKVGISHKVYISTDNLGLIHTAVDVNLIDKQDPPQFFAGVNLFNHLGVDLGLCSENNIFLALQITPLCHVSTSVGLDGVGITLGIDFKNNAYDIDVKAGWGLAFALVCMIYGFDATSAIQMASNTSIR